MLRAVGIPRLDGEDDGPFRMSRIVWLDQPRQQCRIVFDDTRTAPHFDTAALRVIHQEQKRLVILRQRPNGDVLFVAAKIGEGQRPFVKHFEESLGATTMLDVGLTIREPCWTWKALTVGVK